MINRTRLQLNLARKAVLATAAVLAVILPLLAGIVAAPLRAQGEAAAGQGAQSKYEAVSIKPCPSPPPATGAAAAPSGGRGGGAAPWHAQTSPGYVRWDCVPLTTLVDQAYADRDHPLLNTTGDSRPPRTDGLGPIRPKRVRGGPSWVETDKFTIEARAPLDVTAPALSGGVSRNLATLPAPMSEALRATLEDRFQLKVRRATEQRDMYELTVAKGGLNKERIKPTQSGDCLTREEYLAADAASQRNLRICGVEFVTPTSREFAGHTLQQLAQSLSSTMDMYVLDKTGMDGRFTFVLQFDRTAPGRDGTTIGALEALGLKITPTKGPAEYLQIESVQKPRPDGPVSIVNAPGR
jgi:uncharacterized protein (TIGR03435 family)